jgi:preprotein translocase subunit YajC
VGASAYQAVLGVHAPWIAEISPMQYAAMSKAAKAAYDKKRAGEWVASAAVKDQWRAAVLQAYAAGKFRREDPDVHPDADMVVFAAQRQAAQDAAAQQAQARGRENAITRADQVKVGDRVWVLMSGTYETVTRVSQKSVSVTGRFGPMRITMSERVPQLGWLSPHDLAAKG